MAHILHVENELREVATEVKNEAGEIVPGSAIKSFVKAVTFMIDKATPHTITFLPQGTVLKLKDDVLGVVGDTDHAYHEFEDGATAVEAYLNGQI